MTAAEGPVTALEQVCRSAHDLLAGVSPAPNRLRLSVGDVSVELEWPQGGPAPAAGPVISESAPIASAALDSHFIVAPLVGTCYLAPEPGAGPFVRPGDLVERGQKVAIVETMKLMVPVEADCTGRVIEVLTGDGQPVEYGERMIAVERLDVA